MADPTNKVVDACKKSYAAWKDDCSGFVRAVAKELGITLEGNADSIVSSISIYWTPVTDAAQAVQLAEKGTLVIGGLKSSQHTPSRSHGHVVVVVPGAMYQGKYPIVWGGSIGSAASQGTKSVGEVWNRADRDNVKYWYKP